MCFLFDKIVDISKEKDWLQKNVLSNADRHSVVCAEINHKAYGVREDVLFFVGNNHESLLYKQFYNIIASSKELYGDNRTDLNH
jgi:hypothetical protein